MMPFVRSILFALAFYPGTALYVLACFASAPFGDRALRRMVRRWAEFHGWCVRRLLGIRTRVEGALPDGPVLVAIKHQSMYETIAVLELLDDPAVVLKQELANIPGFGGVARLHGVIPVDRAGSSAALRAMLKAGRAAIAQGRSIAIFPEGTRVAPGETPPLRAGFAGLYRQLGLAVVPIAVDSGRLWPRRAFVKRPGTITFRVGETIPPGLSRAEIEARVHEAINALERDPA